MNTTEVRLAPFMLFRTVCTETCKWHGRGGLAGLLQKRVLGYEQTSLRKLHLSPSPVTRICWWLMLLDADKFMSVCLCLSLCLSVSVFIFLFLHSPPPPPQMMQIACVTSWLAFNGHLGCCWNPLWNRHFMLLFFLCFFFWCVCVCVLSSRLLNLCKTIARAEKIGACCESEANAAVSGFDGISGGKKNLGNTSPAEVILFLFWIDFLSDRFAHLSFWMGIMKLNAPQRCTLWNIGMVLNATFGNSSRRQDRGYLGFPEHLDAVLNWSSLPPVSYFSHWNVGK